MKRKLLWPAAAVLTIFLTALSAGPAFADNGTSTVSSAQKDLRIAVNSKSIKPQELQQAQGLAIIPSYWKAALVGGWQHGVGVLMVKKAGKWSNPVFISASGGSLGAQVGFVTGDMIMLFKNKQDVDKIINGTFRLGVSATAAAGAGEKAAANTSPSNVSTYVDIRGGFIGAAAKGVEISADPNSKRKFYGSQLAAANTLIAGQITVPKPAKDLQQTADQLSGQ
jgi:lipid-binding SYLF domain-containing protein